jgi:flavin-dependent dehydrogenase
VQLRVGSIQRADRAAPGWRVSLSSGEPVDARALIDATGRACTLARSLGARARRRAALVALQLVLGRDEGNGPRRHLVEATEDGWWFAARLADGRVTGTFFTDVATSRERLARPQAWAGALARTRHLRELRGIDSATLAGTAVRVVDASDVALDHCAGEGWIACGDAAQAFDPLTSHGLVHALHTGACAGTATAQALAGDTTSRDELARDERLLAIRCASMGAQVYGQESRWPDALFWRARRGSPAAAVQADTA